MKLVYSLPVIIACALSAPSVAVADDSPCLTMSWSGGAAGAGMKHTRAWFTKLDEKNNSMTIRYDHQDGRLNLGMRMRGDGRYELTGRWVQRGSSGGRIFMILDKKQKTGSGFWTSEGSAKQYELTLRVGGPSCP